MKKHITNIMLLSILLGLVLILSLSCKNVLPEETADSSRIFSSTVPIQENTELTTKAAQSPSDAPTSGLDQLPKPIRQLQALYPMTEVYKEAADNARVIFRLEYLQEIGLLSGPVNNDFYEVLLADGQIGFCKLNMVSNSGYDVFAKTIEEQIKSALPEAEGKAADKTIYSIKLVDVRKQAPEIQISLAFARNENIIGEKLYERPICLLQEGTLEKLKKAQDIFAADGYTIKIFDAYRPYDLTVRFKEYMDNSDYYADSLTGSDHNRGAAIDMTLVDSEGRELEMPGPIHIADYKAKRDNQGMTAEARRNLDYMSAVMERSGFLLDENAWWHFSDTDYDKYPVMNYNLDDIEVIAETRNCAVKSPPLQDPEDSGFVCIQPTPPA